MGDFHIHEKGKYFNVNDRVTLSEGINYVRPLDFILPDHLSS